MKHIVLWKLSDACNKNAAFIEIKTALEGLNGVIPGMLSCSVSRIPKGDYDVILESEFETWEAQDAYQTDPRHVACKKIVSQYAVGRTAADFDK